MSEANTGTYDVRSHQPTLVNVLAQANSIAPKHARGRAGRRADSGHRAEIRRFPSCVAERQVREDKEIYIPDVLSLEDNKTDPEHHAAAVEHAKHLYRAEGYLDEAYNLVRVLRKAFEGDGDSRAVQAETVLELVEKKLNKASNRIDRHDRRHTNLFLAYCDIREKPNP